MVSDRLFQFSQTQTALQSFLFLTTQLLSLAYTCTNTILSLTSTKELQVADLFSDLQLEDLLEDLLPQRLLDDSHPLQLLAIQPQQRPSCQEGDYMWMNFLCLFSLMVIENNSDTTDFKDGNNRGVKTFDSQTP